MTQIHTDHLHLFMAAIHGRSLGSPNAWIDEALHDIDQKVEHNKKRRQDENRSLEDGKITLKYS